MNRRADIYRAPFGINVEDGVDSKAIICRMIANRGCRVLDLGCACGDLGVVLKSAVAAEMFGVEYNAESAKIARDSGSYVVVKSIDIEQLRAVDVPAWQGYFDYVVCADVLEHLRNPTAALAEVVQFLKPGGSLIASIPNVSNINVKAQLLQNRFNYTPSGILDETHLRWFTRHSIGEMLADVRLKVLQSAFTLADQAYWMEYDPWQRLSPYERGMIGSDWDSMVCQYVFRSELALDYDGNLLADNLQALAIDARNAPEHIKSFREEKLRESIPFEHVVGALADAQNALKDRGEALKEAKMQIDMLRGTYGYRAERILRTLFTSAFYKSRTMLIKRRIGEILRQHWQNLKARVFTGRPSWADRILYKLLKRFSSRVKYRLVPPQSPPPASQEPDMSTGTTVAKICYDAWYEGDEDFSDRESDVKPIAFYLPQFHTFKENDEWWGKGFTEWTNTRKSEPRFASHYQPREPHADIGYYDLSDWHVMQRQAELARKHGIYGFCFYNYWFSGKRLMEKPVDQFLAHPEIDIHFCLCWANENWTRAWDGGVSQILIGQGYENDSLQYIIDLKKYIEDPRYIRVDGKPVVMVYRPGLLPDATKTFLCWREWARNNGIGEIAIWIQRGCSQNGASLMIEGADAEVEFPPNGTAEFNQVDPRAFGLEVGDGYLLNYQDLVRNVIMGNGYVERYEHTVYRGVMLGWDNAARRRSGFCTWYGFSLPEYYKWCRYVVEDTRKRHGKDDRFFFVNAWNEWAEGTYLEPDKRFGYAAINVTSRALFDMPLHPKLIGGDERCIDAAEEFKAQNLLGRSLPLFPYGLYGMYHPESIRAPAWAWSDCNKQQDPLAELQRLRTRFVADERHACEKLGIKRLYVDDTPLQSGAFSGSIAVHLHLFFLDMLDFSIGYLSNIPYEFDVYISIPDMIKCDVGDVLSRMRRLKNVGKVQIRRCENRGRDIAPLICTFGRDLAKYDYVAHFHTKKSSHTQTHSVWARFIFEHLLGSENRVRRIFSLLQNDYRVVSPPDFLLMPEEPSGWGSNLESAQKLIDLSGMSIDLQKEFPVIEFPQGSMFWARGATLRRFFALPIAEKDFPAEPIGTDGSIAHAFERLFFVWGIEDDAGVCQVFLKGEEDVFARMR